MTVINPAPDSPRIFVRDEIDVRILIVALSLYSVHESKDELASTADSLRDELMASPSGIGYSSRTAPRVTGGEIKERH